MKNHTLKLPLKNGRHLVIGDIHGHLDALTRLMDVVNYDPTVDVIYTVGDMIDRGPDSVGVVDFFLDHPNRFAIKGNHELMALNTEWNSTWIGNGGRKCLEDIIRKGMTHKTFRKRLDPLPWIIEVGEDEEEFSFRIIHAEFPVGWNDRYLKTVLDFSVSELDRAVSPLIWSRELVKYARSNVAALRPPHSGIKFVKNRARQNFVGHTPLLSPMRCKDHWFIDTGSGAGGTLTAIDAVTFKTWSVLIYP